MTKNILEEITRDGSCQTVTMAAYVNQQWNPEELYVDITVEDFDVIRVIGPDRKARLINDWSRHGLLSRFVSLCPRSGLHCAYVKAIIVSLLIV